MSYLGDLLFVVTFRMKKALKKFVPPTHDVEEYERHKVKQIGQKGRFMLLECQNCHDRELAVDKIEAKGIYSRKACVKEVI